MREMLHDVCSGRFDVTSVGSIEEAMRVIDQGSLPDVVLCDLMMPDGGADEWMARCPELVSRTVIITGGPATPRDELLVAAHAERVLYKPFSIANLQAIVGRVTDRLDQPRIARS